VHAPEPFAGHFEGPEHLFALRVYFEDTDLSGLVYHANYLRWFERARSDMLRCVGIDQRSANEDGTGVYAVADLAIRYVRPARLDEAVTIRSLTTSLAAASVTIRQQALVSDRLCAEMTVRVAFIGTDGRPKRQPAAWREAIAAHTASTERTA